ncbi:hypothetical protein C173_12015 [Sporocytophaga myxococcoides]|uniref:Uncharacterized protein n=1 Tax=Sporocytophaga myxococcoides TaxID=153721 RepID=A0A098LAX1_9BACT|nr:hypothetical protein [Sporocytophaga myxococcoides]GAL83599.1 hypothetical protein C173_12015 [Sporocytophaga myxococcoides]
MPENINKTDIFKFVALRPPVPVNKRDLETNFIKDNRKPEESPVGKLVSTFERSDGDKIPGKISDFIQDNKYYIDFPESAGDYRLSKIYEEAKSISKDSFNLESIKEKISGSINDSIASFLEKEESKQLLNNIWDRYYAFYILSKTENQNLEILTKGLRVFHLLDLINQSRINNISDFQRAITAQPLIASLFTDLPKPTVKVEKPEEKKPDPEKLREYNKLWNDFITTHRAIEELRKLKFENKLVSETQDAPKSDKKRGNDITGKITFAKSISVIDQRSFAKLHPATVSILKEYAIDKDNFQVSEPATELQQSLDSLYLSMSNIEDVEFINVMPVEARSIAGLAYLENKIKGLAGIQYKPYIPPTNVRASIKPLGIGELKVVKQKLKNYTAGEVAHIENVLRGEYKERKHRVLDRTEEIFTVSSETSEETTKDTQSTERFELKKESEKTIEEQMSVQAGVTVSGSYGVVTFGAHGEFAYSTSSQESNKNSSNFAREVIDRSVSKIQKRTKEERTVKKLHEVEEINTHGVDNKEKPDHAVGIYRWVDKYYDAQIYNYGKRMMFEFIIPEPAAFYEYAQTHKPKKDIKPPKVLSSTLTHKNITEFNYQDFIRDYNIQGITPPPPYYKTASTVLSSDASIQNGTSLSKSTKELIIPEGYSLTSLSFSLSTIYENNPQFKLSIGSNDMGWAVITDNDARRRWDFQAGAVNYIDGIIPVSLNCYDINSFFVNVTVGCVRSAAKYEQWQIQTFEKIMNAYKALQMEYEEKVAAQEVQQGIAITGVNPRINREIEKVELKKQCIKLLMDTYLFGSFNAMKDNGSNPPDFDIFDAMDEGKTIQFFEQAFEWENLTYLFYPYFWSRRSQWMHKSSIYDNDPLFTKFLQAGSARVVIPVYPAYNDAVMYFLENNGAIWKGGEPPRLNDPLYISLADELRDETDDLGNATPEGTPWEVVLPTTLVYLQNDSNLPTF